MDREKPTLAIYGIQDRDNYPYPLYVHDHNLAVMNQGKVLKFLQQERISRRKRDNTLHVHLKQILKEEKLIGSAYDLIFVDNVVGRTFLLQSGEARFEAPLSQGLSTGLEKGRCWWFGKETEAYVLNHELAHLFSCLPFFGPFKENSLLVHFDGGASKSNFSAAVFRNGKLRWLEYHWDLKMISGIFNANALVFSIIGAKLRDQNAVPGKFMGFAGLGEYRSELEIWLTNNNFFHDIWGNTSHFFERSREDFGITIHSFDQKMDFIQDVAATLQHIFIRKILDKLGDLKDRTGAEYLYYTGGSALNIVANTKILGAGLFKEVYIPPCTEDSGLALGAAAFAEWEKHGKTEVHSPFLNNLGIENYISRHTGETIAKIASSLAAGKMVGVCNGFGEAGPRALGNRSIFARPDSKAIAGELSRNKKGREWYRPLAPVALEKNVKYFTGMETINHLAGYMLLDFHVLPDKREEILGVVHADGTARFQSVKIREENPFLYDLLVELDTVHNIKALINTSFNPREVPIVHTEMDAVQAARDMGLYGIVLNGEFNELI